MADTQKRAIGVFPSLAAAETALQELKEADFPMEQVSVVTQDPNRSPAELQAELSDRTGGNQAQEGLGAGIVTGGALGGLAGVLAGLGMLAIPGVGPVVVGGAAATLAAGIGTAGATLGGLIGAYSNSGTPEQRAKAYQDWLAQGGYLVMVDGTQADIGRAEVILNQHGIQDWGIFGHPHATSNSSS